MSITKSGDTSDALTSPSRLAARPSEDVRYTAVWQQGAAGEIQVYGWTYEHYRAKYDELWQQGWRLKILQPFVLSGDQVRYTAVWQQSTAGEIQVYGWTYEHYRAKYDELWQQGWRLKAIQPYVASTHQLMDRVLRSYMSSGGVASPVGVPLRAVQVTGTEARWAMSGGYIVAKQDGTTEVAVDQNVKVWFVGFKCFEESGELSEKDEPYFVVSWTGNKKSATISYGPYSVNKGDEVVVPQVLADDLPVVTGSVHVAVYENDQGSVKAAREKVTKAMQEVAEASQQAAAIYDLSAAANGNTGSIGPAAEIAALIVNGPVGALVAKGLVAGLGLADDYVGQQGATIFGRETGYVDPPTLGRTSTGEPYTHRFWVNSDGAGDYEVYLRVQIIDRPRPEPG
ncbi:MAG: hypothetical protein M3332_12300 [Actinomycetota bacterium]|nr:hypothetical protein [Actinomycetota bacterium]